MIDARTYLRVNAALEVARGADFQTGFPDQPIRLRFTVDGDLVTMELRSHSVRSVALPRRDFVSQIAAAAAPVFTKLLKLLPENRDSYEHVLGQIRELLLSVSVDGAWRTIG